MKMRATIATMALVTVATSGWGWAQAPTAVSPAGLALDSIFNPQRAPAQKTMGLLQRSFLDMVETSEQELQVAFVIDGTDSMAADIAGVRAALRNMADDLRQYKGNHVSFALVVYRDTGSPSGPVTISLNQFTSNIQVLEKAFGDIKPESGAPYFLELPDLGVHEALDKLNWSKGKESSKWLLLFGDAPPYDANFVDTEKNTGARRFYDTDLLINLANMKEVKISCVLCTSDKAQRAAYEQVLDKTRKFFNDLATNTNGLMLDLSYPDIQAAIVSAAKKTRVERQRIGTITQEEVEAARRAAKESAQPVAMDQRLRVAVLPHMPLAQMTFDPTHEAVQMAAELRQKLKGMPKVDVRSPVDVERALRRVKAGNQSSSLSPDQMLQALAAQLGVDYVVWGSVQRSAGIVAVNSALYSTTDGQRVIDAKFTSKELPENEIAGHLMGKLTLTNIDQSKAPKLYAAFAQVRSNKDLNQQLNQQLIRPVALVPNSRTDLLTGFESLEQALAYPPADPTGAKLLTQAEQALDRAAKEDSHNPFTYMLMASCYYNQAQALMSQGEQAQAKAKWNQMTSSLGLAFRESKNAQVELLKLEISADYSLLVSKNIEAAISSYEKLAAAPNDAKLHTALRAHWMLAGIYSGDWKVDEKFVNAQKAREHLLSILAFWPDSPEAAFIKTNLRWSEEKGRNQFESIPRPNDI